MSMLALTPMQITSLRSVARWHTLAAVAVLVISAAYSIYFFFDLGASVALWFGVITAIMGASFELGKVNFTRHHALARAMGDSLARRRALTWRWILTLLSMVAVFSCLSIMHHAGKVSTAKASKTFEAAEADLNAAKQERQSLGHMASFDVAGARAELAKLEQDKQALLSSEARNMAGHRAGFSVADSLSKHSHYRNTYGPQIDAYDAQIREAKSKLGDYESYIKALNNERQATHQLAALEAPLAGNDGNGVERYANPAFIALAGVVAVVMSPITWLLGLFGIQPFGITAIIVEGIWTAVITITSEAYAQAALVSATEARQQLANGGMLNLHRYTLADLQHMKAVVAAVEPAGALPSPKDEPVNFPPAQ